MLAGGGVEADNAPLIAWGWVEQPVVSEGAVTERKVSGARDWIADGEAVGWAQRRATFDVSSSVAIVGSAASVMGTNDRRLRLRTTSACTSICSSICSSSSFCCCCCSTAGFSHVLSPVASVYEYA